MSFKKPTSINMHLVYMMMEHFELIDMQKVCRVQHYMDEADYKTVRTLWFHVDFFFNERKK